MPFDPAKVEQQVRDTAAKLGVDPDFASDIATVESGFNPAAKSKAGAQGVMQVMPATAKGLAKQYGSDNISQGVGYLKNLNFMFGDVPEDQRPHFVAAAYNAGPTRVMDLMEQVKKQGGDPFNISSFADVLPDETAKYVAKLADRRAGRQPAAPAQAPQETTASPTQETPAARHIQPLGEALMSSLKAGGQRETDAVGQAVDSVRGLADPFQGEPTVGAALGRTGGALMDVLRAAGPALFPRGALGGVAGETAQRMGLLPEKVPVTGTPLTPEKASEAGNLATAGATLAPGLIRGGARLLSPSLRTAEKLTAANAENAAAQVGNEAQFAARTPAGTAARSTTEGIANRLQKQADETFTQAQATEPKALRLQPEAGTSERVVKTTPTNAEGQPLLDQYGKPITSTRTIPAQNPRSLTQKDYSTAFLNLRKSSERAGQTVIDFDRNVTRKLEQLGPHATSKALARDPDLSAALLAHATPDEAKIIQTAMAAGKPLSKLPFSEEKLAQLGQTILQQRSFLTPLLHSAMAGGGLGVMAEHALPGSGLGTTVGVVTGRLALKALDVALASAPSRAALRQLGKLQMDSPEAVRVLAAAGADLAGPRRLQSPAR